MNKIISILTWHNQSCSKTCINTVNSILSCLNKLETCFLIEEFRNQWNDVVFDVFMELFSSFVIIQTAILFFAGSVSDIFVFDGFIKVNTSVWHHLSCLEHVLIRNFNQSDDRKIVKDGFGWSIA